MSTENDAEIARILGEEYDLELNSLKTNKKNRSKFDLPNSTKTSNNNGKEFVNNLQINEDSEIAFILQIEEIVLSENRINKNTVKVTDVQLEKTHADMTKALQPVQQIDYMNRIYGMFITIQNRYTNCQAKNQILIDQIQKLAIMLYPILITFKSKGKSGISKATVPSLALSLITNVLQGSIGINDAKQLLIDMFQLWNECTVWYEFFEQLVYILVAVTVPSFAQGALEKIQTKISSLN